LASLWRQRYKKVEMLDKDTLKVVKTFDSVTEAAKIYGRGVSNVISGRAQTCKGYKWRHKKQERKT